MWKIYNVFHITLLQWDNPKKRRVNKLNNDLPERKFEARDNKEYKVKAIINSAVYNQEINGQISGLYYLIL